jgi:hypothetical protein
MGDDTQGLTRHQLPRDLVLGKRIAEGDLLVG